MKFLDLHFCVSVALLTTADMKDDEDMGSSVKKWVRKTEYMCGWDYYTATTKNEILSFATIWMELEDIN